MREKDLSARALERLTHESMQAIRDNGGASKLLVNGRADVALACDADGVHLPAGELPASEVRALWSKASERTPVVGVSAHSLDEVRYAEAHGANFAVLAPVFEKAQTPVPAIGLDALREACASLAAPGNVEAPYAGRFAVLALGGVKSRQCRGLQAGGGGGNCRDTYFSERGYAGNSTAVAGVVGRMANRRGENNDVWMPVTYWR